MVEAVALKPASAAFMRVVVRGKIIRARRREGTTLTHVITPAKDEYSKPQTVEIRSKAKLGDRDDVVTVECDLGGFERKQFEVTDRDTGERTRVQPVNHTLDAVE